MSALKQCISKQVRIDHKSLDTIDSCFENVQLAKGEYLQREGSICRQLAFIESGYLRMYALADGKEITFWIGGAGKFITALSSFVFKTDSLWNIQAVTDCSLRVISRTDHFKLSREIPVWQEFDNLLLAHSFHLLEQSMFAQLHTTARERLVKLLEQEPDLFLHVPHQYIASMLGIAPESLSRLRKDMRQKHFLTNVK